ncbi:hypothetical protein GGR57DRAFT_517507 [Xylariaceae sp. FL1272]|nr:hypothetical protein GGR57DRAFT_517507 [Xylariaceae sp. FL1272]
MDELDGYGKNPNQAQCDSDASTNTTSCPGIKTPSTLEASPRTPYSTPPKTGKSYMIIEKQSRGAVTVKNDLVYLHRMNSHLETPYNTWLLVDRQHYKGFFNEHIGIYLGVGTREYRGDRAIIAQARGHKKCEFFTIDHVSDEYYQLLMPESDDTLSVISAADGTHLVRRHDGTTAFKFIEVDE